MVWEETREREKGVERDGGLGREWRRMRVEDMAMRRSKGSGYRGLGRRGERKMRVEREIEGEGFHLSTEPGSAEPVF